MARATKHSRRPFVQDLSVRRPRVGRALMSLAVRLPAERMRNTVLLRALRDSDAAFNRGDFDAAFALLASDVEFHLPPAFPGAEILRGRAAVVDYYRGALNEWDDVHLWHEAVHSVTPSAIDCSYTLSFRGAETKLGFEMVGTQRLELDGGTVRRVVGDLETSSSTDDI